MANYAKAFIYMLEQEGGYCLHRVKGDRGGLTFAGIAQNFWPKWEGWDIINKGNLIWKKGKWGEYLQPGGDAEKLKGEVATFYLQNFWAKIKGSGINSDAVAASVFSFAVNSGTKTGIRVVQAVLGVRVDGDFGPGTLAALNAADPQTFIINFAFGKIKRYAEIVKRNPTQAKFLPGWVNRTMDDLEKIGEVENA